MKRTAFVIAACICCLGGGDLAVASKSEGKPVTVKVEIGKVTEVVLPGKIVKVIKGGQPDSVLVEVLDHSIYLLPKTDTPAEIFVSVHTGESYPLILQLSQERDIKVQVGSPDHQEFSTRTTYHDVMDLMKDLLLEKEPLMSTVLPHEGQIFLQDQHIQATVSQAYEVGDWRAYVLTAKNLTDQPVIVPVQQISAPNLLAVSSTRDMLSARGEANDSTKIYLIVRQ